MEQRRRLTCDDDVRSIGILRQKNKKKIVENKNEEKKINA